MHIKKQTGEFIDAKSKAVHENYIFNQANPQRPDESDQEIWLRSASGVSHGWIYGVGSMIDVAAVHANKRTRRDDFSPSPPPPPPPPPPNVSQPVYTQEEVDAMLLDERRHNQEDIDTRMLEERRHNFDQFSAICHHIGLEPPQMDEISFSAASVIGSQNNEVGLGAQESPDGDSHML